MAIENLDKAGGEISESLGEQTARLKLGLVALYARDPFVAFLIGVQDYHEWTLRKLGRLVLGRDPVFTDDIKYQSGTIIEIGGQKVDGYIGTMPASIGGRKIKYGLFGTPLGFEE